LVTTDAELEAAEKVSCPSPSSSDFRCPLANKIVKALTRDRSLKHPMKPWSGPLPKPRISPPKTLGDAVIKDSRIRLHGGRTVPMLFKMSIPSTTNASISSFSPTQTNHQDVTLLEWPSIPNIRLPHKTPRSEAISSQVSSTAQSKAAELQNSNSESGKANQEPNLTRSVNRILIQNGPARAWFYPSKGLNVLFSRAGKPKVPGIKTTALVQPSPNQQSPPNQTRRRRTYAETVRMNLGGDGGKGQETGRAVGGEGGRAPANRVANTGIGEGCSDPVPENGGIHFNPGRNIAGYNPGHTRGRTYGGYARGWQRPPFRGYRYTGSRFHWNDGRGRGNVGRGGGDQDVGQDVSHGTGAVTNHQILMGGMSVQAIAVGPQQELQAPEVFMTQKAGKTKLEVGLSASEGKEKPFCFRCWKPGHGKLECVAKLLCDICGNTEHLTGKCPILKQPRLLAHPCGYDVSGLGFYHIPHAPITPGKTDNRTALVTVQGGELSIPQLVAELSRLIPERWHWTVTQ
jgi:hypothetical protein